MPPLIELRGVTKRFGKKLVINHVDLSVPEGKILGILGTNGSGKTTLLKILIGFYDPDKGEVLYKDRRFTGSIRKKFGFATQENAFYPQLSVYENMLYFGRLYGLHRLILKDNIKKILNLVELWDAKGTLGENLSGGMMRRLDFACALVHNPDVIIFDEPTEGLDPALRKEILNLIKTINKQGKTVVLTSHLLTELESLCDNIAILNNKTIITSGTISELKDRYSKNQEIQLETFPGKYDNIIKKLKVDKVVKRGNKLVIYTSDATKVLSKILKILSENKEKLIDVDVDRPSLNEVFEALTSKEYKRE